MNLLEHWRIGKPQIRYPVVLTLFAIAFLFCQFCIDSTYAENPVDDILSPDEYAWLQRHDGEILFAPSPEYPPVGFINEMGLFKGITADYIKLLEKMLNFKFKFVYYKTWNDIIQSAKKEDVDVIGNIQDTPKRREYLLFTQPYLTIPNSIVVRNDLKKSLTLATMKGMKVAVVQGYATIDYIRRHADGIILKQVKNNPEGLQMVSFGRADAMITDLAVASYYLKRLGITNLRVAGSIDFTWDLCFAVKKKLPMLQQILRKGLAAINEHERNRIYDKWIHLGKQTVDWRSIAIMAGSLLFGFILIITWNISLKRQVRRQTSRLEDELVEKNRIEKLLHESLLRQNEAVKAAKVGLWDWDLTTNKVIYSAEWKSQIGYAEHEIGDDFEEWKSRLHPSDLQATLDKIQDSISKGWNDHQVDFRFRHKDGSYRWILAQASIIKDKSGQPIRMVGSHIDITDRKSAEQHIEHLNRVLRAVRDVNQLILRERDPKILIRECCRIMVDGQGYTSTLIMLTDDDNRLNCWAESGIAASDTLKAMLNCQILPPCCDAFRTATDAVVIDDRIVVCGSCPISNEYAKTTSLCAKLIHKNKAFGYMVVTMDRDIGADDELLSLFSEIAGDLAYALSFIRLGTDHELSERKRKRLEHQLIQAQKMESVGRLAGGVAHDFNNMLSIIIGYAQLAMEKLDSSEPLHTDIVQIFEAAKRSSNITRQLLAFARQQTTAPKVLDLNTNIESLLKMLRRLIGEDVDLAWRPGVDLWPVKIDPSQVDQILANLCVNARDAIVGVGKLTIETRNTRFDEEYCADHAGFIPGKFILLAVSDTGHGMAPEIQDKIFDPFFTTKNLYRGTGLGLSTVYGIVKQNNGFINVYSEPEKGTTIKIYLPRHTGQIVETRREITQEIPVSRGETVLLVEDDSSILKLTERILESLGYTVLSASTPSEAIHSAKDHANKIDLLMTDVVMPEMNGRELSIQLFTNYPNLKVLFMSGYTANVIAHRGVLEDGVNFIPKPFSKRELAEKVRKTLDNI